MGHDPTPSPITVDGDVARIGLLSKSRGIIGWTQIDSEDIAEVLLIAPRWCSLSGSNQLYAVAWRNYRTFLLHRVITGAKEGDVVDHINHDPLDNRKSNLRIVTPAENAQNRKGASRHSKLGVRGVRFCPGKPRPYRATVIANKKRFEVGYFATLEEADKAASEARQELFAHPSTSQTKTPRLAVTGRSVGKV